MHISVGPCRQRIPLSFLMNTRIPPMPSTTCCKRHSMVAMLSLRQSAMISSVSWDGRTPREGGDKKIGGFFMAKNVFQSTPPARGATFEAHRGLYPYGRFNPHPPRGGRLATLRERSAAVSRFNPHPPRGGRHVRAFPSHTLPSFQSTPPARGATAEITEKTPEISAMCITQFHFCTKVHKVQEKKCI